MTTIGGFDGNITFYFLLMLSFDYFRLIMCGFLIYFPWICLSLNKMFDMYFFHWMFYYILYFVLQLYSILYS